MRDIRLPERISDSKQRDPKSKSFAEDMGITRHERQTFPMGMRLPDIADDEVLVERIVNELDRRGLPQGSWKASTYKGHTVKVTVSGHSAKDVGYLPDVGTATVFEWVVRQDGKVLRTGYALISFGGITLMWDTSSSIGERKGV